MDFLDSVGGGRQKKEFMDWDRHRHPWVDSDAYFSSSSSLFLFLSSSEAHPLSVNSTCKLFFFLAQNDFSFLLYLIVGLGTLQLTSWMLTFPLHWPCQGWVAAPALPEWSQHITYHSISSLSSSSSSLLLRTHLVNGRVRSLRVIAYHQYSSRRSSRQRNERSSRYI